MVLVPLRKLPAETEQTPAFGSTETRKPRFGSENSPKFQFVSRILKNKSGAAAIEYALLASIISIGIITGAKNLGDEVGKYWDEIAEAIGADDGGKGKGKDKGKGKK